MQTRDFMIAIFGIASDIGGANGLSVNQTSKPDHDVTSWLESVTDS